MTTDVIDNIQIQTGTTIQTETQTTTTETQGTGTEGKRTIGDGNSKRDQELINELNTIQ